MKGETYSKSSLIGIRASLSRHLKSPPHNKTVQITADKEFIFANRVFCATLKKMRIEGLDKAKSYPPITGEDLLKLKQDNAFDTTSPTQLQEKVWWDIHYNFARRGRENDRQMKKDTFIISQDASGLKFIEMSFNEFTKNHRGDTSDVHPRCYANHTKTCPVESFQNYLAQLHPEIDCLWQRPSITNKKSWYMKCPLGVNRLGTMMERISKRLNLSKKFTNHSVRATTITNLSEAGVEARHIAKLSGHRSLQSIDNYNKDCSESQKRHFSSILQGSNTADTSATATTTAKQHCSNSNPESSSYSRSTPTPSTFISASSSTTSTSTSTTAPSSLWLQNCTINGNISITNNNNYNQ